MKVTLTAQARTDLREIGRWIARDNPARAISFVQELRQRVVSLGDSFGLYPPFPNHGANVELRRLNHGSYRIIYRVDRRADLIEVLHIHHGRRADPSL